MQERILKMLQAEEDYLSGQEICDCLGVSRTTVWKAIKKLRENGYEIEAASNKGYLLKSQPDIVSDVAIRPYLKTETMGQNICYYDELSSTNTRAKELGEAGAPEGTLVIADSQNAGKGRRGKSWVSPKGKDIYMTVLLYPQINQEQAPQLTLVAAVSVAKAIREVTGLECGVKWPNDIVLCGKKICGILTEMSSEPDCIHYVVVGIGINVNMQAFPDEIKDMATSLLIEGKQSTCRAKLTASVLNHFEQDYQSFCEHQSLRGLRKEYDSLLINNGKDVKIVGIQEEYSGIAQGIDEDGRLLVAMPGGIVRKVVSGEVSVRGLYGYV